MLRTTFPLRHHLRAQEELAQGFDTESGSGTLGGQSNMGPIIAMIEGSRGSSSSRDIVDDPWAAYEEVQRRANLHSARDYRRFVTALRKLPKLQQDELRAVYGHPTHETFWLAFGGAANLLPVCRITQEHGSDSYAWAVQLATRVAGEPYRENGMPRRHPAKASEKEKEIALEIRRETIERLSAVLVAYVDARRLVR